MSLLNHATLDLNVLQRFGFFSSSSAESKENEVPKTGKVSEDAEKATGEAKGSGIDLEYRDTVSNFFTKRIAFFLFLISRFRD